VTRRRRGPGRTVPGAADAGGRGRGRYGPCAARPGPRCGYRRLPRCTT
jgi:hypothetical protein